MLDNDLQRIAMTLPGLYELAIGGIAVGTRLNSPEFADKASAKIAVLTNQPFVSALISSRRWPAMTRWSSLTARSRRSPVRS